VRNKMNSLGVMEVTGEARGFISGGETVPVLK
jgi:hypothetical protein